MHQGLPDRPVRLAQEHGKKTHAVLGRIVGQSYVKDVCAGGHEIHQRHELPAGRAGLNNPGPADDKRHAVTAIEDVGLVAAKDVWLVAKKVSH